MPLTINSQTQCTWDNSGFTWDDLSANQNWDANYIYDYGWLSEETLNFEEENSNSITLVGAETLALVDVFIQGHSFTINENINFAEAVSNLTTWQRALAETLAFVEAVGKGATINKAEAFEVSDLMMRQGPVVIGNLGVRNDTLSLATFLDKVAEGVSGAWLPYRTFVPGDYDFMKALVRVTLRRDNTAQDVRLVVGKIFADMPDVVESRTTTVSSTAGVTNVLFNKTFVAIPVVAVSLVSTTANAKVRISNVTLSGFDLEIVDETNARVTGIVGWQARGY